MRFDAVGGCPVAAISR